MASKMVSHPGIAETGDRLKPLGDAICRFAR
jgi:hypothetical protein